MQNLEKGKYLPWWALTELKLRGGVGGDANAFDSDYDLPGPATSFSCTVISDRAYLQSVP